MPTVYNFEDEVKDIIYNDDWDKDVILTEDEDEVLYW